jgi:hypothetical protein
MNVACIPCENSHNSNREARVARPDEPDSPRLPPSDAVRSMTGQRYLVFHLSLRSVVPVVILLSVL